MAQNCIDFYDMQITAKNWEGFYQRFAGVVTVINNSELDDVIND